MHKCDMHKEKDMGQYHLTVNLTKREYLNPHGLAAGLKAWEQLANFPGPGVALVYLLACPTPRGGGDLKPTPYMGRWHGDRVALVGDYAASGDLSGVDASTIYEDCLRGEYLDITFEVAACLEGELSGTFTGEGWRQWGHAPLLQIISGDHWRAHFKMAEMPHDPDEHLIAADWYADHGLIEEERHHRHQADFWSWVKGEKLRPFAAVNNLWVWNHPNGVTCAVPEYVNQATGKEGLVSSYYTARDAYHTLYLDWLVWRFGG